MRILGKILAGIAFVCIMLGVIVGTTFACVFVFPIFAIIRKLDEPHN